MTRLSAPQTTALLAEVLTSIASGVTAAAVATILTIGYLPTRVSWPLWIYVTGLVAMAMAIVIHSGQVDDTLQGRSGSNTRASPVTWAFAVAILVAALIGVGVILPEYARVLVLFEYVFIAVGFLTIGSFRRPGRDSYSKRSIYALALTVITLVSAGALVAPLVVTAPHTSPVVVSIAAAVTVATPTLTWLFKAHKIQ